MYISYVCSVYMLADDFLLLTYTGGDVYGHHCNGSQRLTHIVIGCEEGNKEVRSLVIEILQLSGNFPHMENCIE